MISTGDSVVVRALANARRVADTSRVVRTVEGLSGSLGRAGATSRTVAGSTRVADTLDRWIRGAWLYGWLTAEPEPDVIVVDLRETYTVGPVLAVLDRAVAWAGPRWRGSRPRRLFAVAVVAVVDAPVRIGGWFAVGALLASLAVALVRGGATTGPRLVALGLALLATRERRSAAELRETRAGRALAALLVPPEPPEDELERASLDRSSRSHERRRE